MYFGLMILSVQLAVLIKIRGVVAYPPHCFGLETKNKRSIHLKKSIFANNILLVQRVII